MQTPWPSWWTRACRGSGRGRAGPHRDDVACCDATPSHPRGTTHARAVFHSDRPQLPRRVMTARRYVAALLAAAGLARAPRGGCVPTTLCVTRPEPGGAPLCVTRAKYALESARGASGDFGVQGADYTSCERCGTRCVETGATARSDARFDTPALSPLAWSVPSRRSPARVTRATPLRARSRMSWAPSALQCVCARDSDERPCVCTPYTHLASRRVV